ncbi:adenosylcobinamide-GDP ribazoletransferase [Paenibacillus sp. sptzw28]|uniref:adenosylcobinamide-GDP ribazoletransferase n=1 Tax=Paenibacillus sp. sptzw28 TaxID=715179 RepID=UPI001C6E5349|nr:adenosylcobinamide-GDP ribazoletransferase [Paenibacillus sp. sptzw28]QYR19684.1 adenosylcobinamide-GDP ribazoletransferase [Paenibacillus sp. sptzw28]
MVLRSVREQLQAAGAALQLMTRLPVPVQIPFKPLILARSVVYYPLVGAIIGLIAAGAGWLLSLAVPPLPAVVIVLIVWTGLSGALHLDGLMDTADGVLSHRPRERMLEIMKDSRVGAMGVMAAVFLLLLKFAVLATLFERQNWPSLMPVIAAACAWSRLWIVCSMAWWPFARPKEGLASMFAGVRARHAGMALAMQALVVIVLGLAFGQLWSDLWLWALVQAAVTLLSGMVLSRWLNRKLGGLTGDTYGAMNEIIETLLLFAALWHVR